MERFISTFLVVILLSLLLASPYMVASSIPPKPFEVDVSEFLPDNSFSWTMFKADALNTYYAESSVPRFPLTDYELNVSANIGGHLGPALVDGDLLVIGGWEVISAYNVLDGHLLWTRNILDEFSATIASYALGDRVYVATESRYDAEGNTIPSLLIALNRVDGSLSWKTVVGTGGTDVTSNLVLVSGRLVFGTGWADSKVYCFSVDGSLLWATQLEGMGNIRGVAVGGATVVATGENGYNVYGLDLVDGGVKWVYRHDAIPGTPLYWNGRIYFIDSVGKLVCLGASDGRRLFTRDLRGQVDVDTNSRVAVSSNGDIYIVRREETLVISKLNSDGELIATYSLNDVDLPGFPVICKRIVLLPAYTGEGVKLYIFWSNLRLINELAWETGESFIPTVSASNASIFLVYALSYGQRLVKLADPIQPNIISVEYPTTVYIDEPIDINATVMDGESGIYRVILFYRVGGGKIYSLDMELLRRYISEPVGGYGLTDEPYGALIPSQDRETMIEFRILVVDNSGNYVLSPVYKVAVEPRPQEYPSIWIILPVLAVIGLLVYISWVRMRH